MQSAYEENASDNCMPESWSRAAMLIRINSLASGHSGVRPLLVNGIVELLRKDIVPRIPLRGSISASGDLMPLSYIGGTLEGKRGLTVWAGPRSDRRIVTADVALAEASIEPIRLGPKEGLAIINGTAVSSAVAALAVHDAKKMAVLCQILSAMSVEALCGTFESFHPLFAIVRPHPGQIDVGRNIRGFLSGSKLAQHNDGSKPGSLRQDRYSIRTASQWIGPVLEDLSLASRQIHIECNSVTDNPLIDIDPTTGQGVRTLHGGNFQARVVTSAMEKVRMGMQSIGQMLFTQCTEIINPRLNYGLPPSLAVDEPSQSFLLKPLDIMIAALQSELGFLSNPAGTHVQPAEMGNQALNSLGLISARYTHVALDVLAQLAAAHIFTLCQALDLRAMQMQFLQTVEPILRAQTVEILGCHIEEGTPIAQQRAQLLPTTTSRHLYENAPAEGDLKSGEDASQNAPLMNRDKSAESPTEELLANTEVEIELNGVQDGAHNSPFEFVENPGESPTEDHHPNRGTEKRSNGTQDTAQLSPVMHDEKSSEEFTEKEFNSGQATTQSVPLMSSKKPGENSVENESNSGNDTAQDSALMGGEQQAESPIEDLHAVLWKDFTNKLDLTTTLDSSERFPAILRDLEPVVFDFVSPREGTIPAVKQWSQECASSALRIFIDNRDSYHTSPDASTILGNASGRMYRFVREELGVPFLRTQMLKQGAFQGDFTTNSLQAGGCDLDGSSVGDDMTTGSLITRIYQAIRSGTLYIPVMECLAAVEQNEIL